MSHVSPRIVSHVSLRGVGCRAGLDGCPDYRGRGWFVDFRRHWLRSSTLAMLAYMSRYEHKGRGLVWSQIIYNSRAARRHCALLPGNSTQVVIARLCGGCRATCPSHQPPPTSHASHANLAGFYRNRTTTRCAALPSHILHTSLLPISTCIVFPSQFESLQQNFDV